MKKIDNDGLLLCQLQATAFENSADLIEASSEIFMRRFMHSQIASLLDNGDILQMNLQPNDLIERIEEEYGSTKYGSIKYTKNELYWIGYIYRYYAYTYELTSVQVYRIVKPKELRSLFLPYHTLDPSQAIERILEAKNLLFDSSQNLQRQFEIFKKIREA